MKFGVAISTSREGLFYPVGFATPESFVEVSKKAEEFGFDCVWGNDHFTTQNYIKKRGETPNFFEPMITFSYLCAFTKKLRFGTGVVIGPTRHPVTLAKQAITLDHLSAGRFILGIGLGAYREEFEAFGGIGNRGAMLDEMIAGLDLLLGDQHTVSYSGKYFSFKDIDMFPKPITRPFPLYIGGNSPGVLRRVGQHGAGWIPASLSLTEIQEARSKINEFARSKGRDPSKIAVAPESICGIHNDPMVAKKRFVESLVFEHLMSLQKSTLKNITISEEGLVARNFIGSPADIIKKVEPYANAGIDQLWFDFVGSKNAEVLGQMEQFADEVMPSF